MRWATPSTGRAADAAGGTGAAGRARGGGGGGRGGGGGEGGRRWRHGLLEGLQGRRPPQPDCPRGFRPDTQGRAARATPCRRPAPPPRQHISTAHVRTHLTKTPPL